MKHEKTCQPSFFLLTHHKLGSGIKEKYANNRIQKKKSDEKGLSENTFAVED